MKTSIVTDEPSDDFQTAVEIACSWGLRNFEIRNAWLGRIPDIPPSGIEIIKRVIKEYDINITFLSPGVFKIPLYAEEMGYHRGELIHRTFKLARETAVFSAVISLISFFISLSCRFA